MTSSSVKPILKKTLFIVHLLFEYSWMLHIILNLVKLLLFVMIDLKIFYSICFHFKKYIHIQKSQFDSIIIWKHLKLSKSVMQNAIILKFYIL